MFVRAYLRASSVGQDANRARSYLEEFATELGVAIAAWYVENESGAKLDRPELFRLLQDSRPGDVLLIEQVDRLSRLTATDWDRLKVEIAARRVRIVSKDLPTSHIMVAPKVDEFTGRMFEALNGMLIDMLAAISRKDFEDRRRRQAEGQARAKVQGKYKGRVEDVARNTGIAQMLKAGISWSSISSTTGASRATIAKIARRLRARKDQTSPVAA